MTGPSHIDGSLQGLFTTPQRDTSAEETPSGLEPLLEENLCTLVGDATGEQLIERILYADSGKHVIIGGPNPPLYRFRGRMREFRVPKKELEQSVADVQDGETVFLFGISLGEQAAHILRTRPNCKVIAWDRDPWLMRLALTGQDYKYSLGTGRLTLCLGADLIDHLPSMPDYRLVMHPVLREFYEDELLLTQEATRGEHKDEDRKWVGLGMGGVVYNELSAAVRAEGYSVFPLEVRRWDPRETRIALQTLRPERVVTINYNSEVASVCHELEIPLVAWEVDPKTDRPPTPPAGGEDFRVFTLHPKDVGQLEDAGFSSVGYLPIGVDTDKRYPLELNEEERSRFAARVCFVGSSLIDRARRFKRLFLQLHASFNCSAEESFDETSERLERVLAAERANYGVYNSDQLLEEQFGEFLEAARRNGTPDDPKKWVAEIVASQKRVAYVSALSDFGIHVWGDDRWSEISAAVPGVHYRGLAEQGHELTCVYSSAEIHVDVNRIYQPEAIPMRVINVMACGGFMIAEHSESIQELFEVGKEIETYRTIEELETKVAHYLENPGEAREIAQRGLEAVRQRHTMRIRAASLLA